MKKALLLYAVLLLTASSFADTIINNFTGYNDGYKWFGAQPGLPRPTARFSLRPKAFPIFPASRSIRAIP